MLKMLCKIYFKVSRFCNIYFLNFLKNSSSYFDKFAFSQRRQISLKKNQVPAKQTHILHPFDPILISFRHDDLWQISFCSFDFSQFHLVITKYFIYMLCVCYCSLLMMMTMNSIWNLITERKKFFPFTKNWRFFFCVTTVNGKEKGKKHRAEEEVE